MDITEIIFTGFLGGLAWPLMMRDESYSKYAVIGAWINGVFFSALGLFGLVVGAEPVLLFLLLLLLGIYEIIGGIYAPIYIKKAEIEAEIFSKNMAEQEAEAKERNKRNPELFYKKCYEQGITTISAKADRARAELIAQDFVFDSFEQFFEKGREMYSGEVKRMEDDRIAALKKEEKAEYDKLTKYSELFGRDKLLAMIAERGMALDADIAHSEASLKRMGALSDNIAGISTKSGDWAIAGGIADAIAGPAAGVMVALDVQRSNNEMAALKKDMLRNMAIVEFKEKEYYWELLEKRKGILAELEAAKKKLVEEIPTERLMKYMEFSHSVEISDTGAFKISVRVRFDKYDYNKEYSYTIDEDGDRVTNGDFTIYDTVKAYIDGTFKAELYQKGEMVGEALLVLPENGLGSSCYCYVNGICLEGAKKDIPYNVKFVPYKLWAIEE